MQRNYPQIFFLTDDRDKEGFKFENVGLTLSSFAVVTHEKLPVVLYFGSTFRLRITINISLN